MLVCSFFILYYHSFLIEMWIVINMSAVNAVNCVNDQKSLKAEKKDHSSDLRRLSQNLD